MRCDKINCLVCFKSVIRKIICCLGFHRLIEYEIFNIRLDLEKTTACCYCGKIIHREINGVK